VDSDEEPGAEGQLHSQPRASRHSKKPQKPPHRTIIIAENVNITNGNFSLVGGGRDESRSQRSSTPTRNPPRRQPNRAKKQSTVQCESPSASDDDITSCSDDSRSEYVAPKRSARSMNPPERPRLHSGKKRRDQADEGYHTSGTVSYTAQVPGKGKGKERSVSSVGSTSSRPRLSSSSGSRISKERETETDATSYHSDGDNREEASADEYGQTELTAQLEDEEASDDVRTCAFH
jgi:hypothetical protein